MPRLNDTDSHQDAAIKLCDGNHGGLAVLLRLLKIENGYQLLMILDELGLYGSAIWIAYKDFSRQNFDRFTELLQERSPDMVKYALKEQREEIEAKRRLELL